MDRIEAAVRELADAIRAELRPAIDPPARLLSIDEAAAACGVGRTTLYAEIQAGRLRSIKVGRRRRLVPQDAIADYIARAAA